MSRKVLALAAVSFAACFFSEGNAFARDLWINPRTMGANALPSFPAEPPWAESYTLARIGGAAQWGRRNDVSFTPTFRLAAPFGKWVTAIFEGTPVEVWWSSPETRSEWALPRDRGVSKGDIRFGVKLLLADFGPALPKIAFRAMTKTTTGKDYDARRFTDAPGYLLELLAGERFFNIPGLTIDVYAGLGYWIWQQGSAGQNDAVHWSLAGALRALDRLNLELQIRGYAGWQRDDKPLLIGVRVGVDVTHFLEIGATCNVGFIDAPRLEGRLDLSFRLPALVPLVFGSPVPQPTSVPVLNPRIDPPTSVPSARPPVGEPASEPSSAEVNRS